MNTTPIKPTLQAMEVGNIVWFPKKRRASVRTTTFVLKEDENMIFKTWVVEHLVFVERKK